MKETIAVVTIPATLTFEFRYTVEMGGENVSAAALLDANETLLGINCNWFELNGEMCHIEVLVDDFTQEFAVNVDDIYDEDLNDD